MIPGTHQDLKSVCFSSTRTWGLNRVGKLKRDKTGYVTVIVGALNCFNSANMYYDYEKSKAMFSESSQLQRRIQNKSLYGELGHPRQEPGMNDTQFRMRLLDVVERNWAVHFRKVYLDPNLIKDPQGRSVVAIVAEACPAGPHANVMEQKLANPDENLCFSIRSFTHDWIEGGVVRRQLVKISTFDLVGEPGIAVADKFHAPSLESIDHKPMSRGDLVLLEREVTRLESFGMESAVVAEDFQIARNLMGWKDVGRPVAPWANW